MFSNCFKEWIDRVGKKKFQSLEELGLKIGYFTITLLKNFPVAVDVVRVCFSPYLWIKHNKMSKENGGVFTLITIKLLGKVFWHRYVWASCDNLICANNIYRLNSFWHSQRQFIQYDCEEKIFHRVRALMIK